MSNPRIPGAPNLTSRPDVNASLPARVDCRGDHVWRVVSADILSAIVVETCRRCGETRRERKR